MSYDERQVLVLDGRKYLVGPAIFYDVDGDGDDVSVTAEDIYNVQRCGRSPHGNSLCRRAGLSGASAEW